MRAFNRKFQKIARGIYKLFFGFATITFSVLLIILLYNVFSRNFLDGSVTWIEEGSKFIFTWMMFLGVSIGVYRKKHLGVEFLVDKYPQKVQHFFAIFNDVFMIVLFLILTIYGFKYSASTMRMYSPIMAIPYGLVYLCVPFCGVLSLFYCIAKIINDLWGDEEGKQE